MDLPEKMCYKTKCKYQFLGEETPFETKIVEKNKNPVFDYKGVHDVKIDDDLIQQLMYNSLTISVWGMIESKRKEIIKNQQAEIEEHEEHMAIQKDRLSMNDIEHEQALDNIRDMGK